MTLILGALPASAIVNKAGQLILSLSVIIILHEMGHFLPAKWFKCRVEKFMLFFDAGFSLFRKKIGETVYGLGWIPLGGYVKISGMIDESLDKEQLRQPPQPYEFRSKPAWQRLIIMAGGVTMNALLAFALFAIILQVWGDSTLPPQGETYGLYADSLGREVGLRDGDVITALDGVPVKNEFTVPGDIFTKEVKVLTVNRAGSDLKIALPDTFIGQLSHNRLENFIEIRIPTVVDSVVKDKSHFISGRLQQGDRLVTLNGQAIPTFTDLNRLAPKYKLDTVDLGVLRGTDTVHVLAKEDSSGRIGFIAVSEYSKLLPVVTTKYGFFESFPAGIRKASEVMRSYILQIRVIFFNRNVKTKDTLGSVVSIGNAYSGTWDWESTWKLTAFLSVILGFMNILPIPALDGGHILFLLVEMISGRKPGDKFLEYAQISGMIVLFGLMAYALGLDFLRIFHH